MIIILEWNNVYGKDNLLLIHPAADEHDDDNAGRLGRWLQQIVSTPFEVPAVSQLDI